MTDSTYTHLAIVADRSGSMTSIAYDMNGGLATLLQEQDKIEGKLLVDVTTFDGEAEQIFTDASVRSVLNGGPIIKPRGSTALLDALGSAIASLGQRLEKLPEDERPSKVIFVVVTDGQENASREYTASQVKEAVERQQTDYQWEFVFLGANIDSITVAGGLGFTKGRTMDYAANAEGTASVLRSASAYLTSSRLGEDASFSQADRDAAVGTN